MSCHEKSSCEPSPSSCSTKQPCPVEQSISQSSCPVDNMVECWNGSFFKAMKAAQIEILKGKIIKNWGPLLEKEADAVVKAMGTHWKSMLQQAMAQQELRESLKAVLAQEAK